MSKIYYKVCAPSPLGKQMSATYPDNPLGLEYTMGEWTKPKKGKLFVFKTLRDAYRWMETIWNTDVRVFECEIKKPTKMARMCRMYVTFSRFWDMKRNKRKPTMELMEPPVGTVPCSAVKLIRKV